MDKFNRIKLFLLEHKKIFIIGICGIIFVSLLLIGEIFIIKNKESESVIYEPVLEEKKETVDEEIYYIDIKGYVNNPGVYAISKGKRVVDAINQAGGLMENSNTSLLNLSMLLKDQMVIIVYSNEEINSLEETIKKQQAKETICTNNVKNDVCITTSKTTVTPKIESKSTNGDIASEIININIASKEVLMTLSKIGESKANAIIEYREKNGAFKAIEEIKNVSGIGDSIFEAIKDYITV